MDPNATLAAWLEADDRIERHELASAYNGWISKGGFPALATVRDDAHPHDVLRLTDRWAVVTPDGERKRNVHRVNLSRAA